MKIKIKDAIIINGVLYELIEDRSHTEGAAECIDCALGELCCERWSGALCVDLFGDAEHKRFERIGRAEE